MTAPAVVDAQASQAGLAAVVAGAVPSMLRELDVHDLAASRSKLLLLLAAVARKYGLASATLSARQYEATRRMAGLAGTFTVHPSNPAPLEQVGVALRWAMSGLYGPEPDVQAFEVKLVGAAEKLTLDAGRRTIVDNVHRDRRATGWARVPEPAPCSFCALLATRGAVYKKNTVGFRSHDHCRCHAEPLFGDYEASDRVQRWQDLYASIPHGKPAQMRADFRRAFEAHP